MASEQGLNQSVERAAAVLGTFLREGPELRVSDVARAVGLGVSTTSRLLSTLESLDYVERDPVSGLYRLGLTPVMLAGSAVNRHPVHREARQVAQDLACRTGLGVNVAVRRGDALFYLLNFEGRDAPRSFTLMGQHNPLHCTGMGKCLLLAMDPQERRALLGDTLPAYTAHTVTEHDALDQEVEAIRGRGYGTEVEELALGRACVAAPVRDRSGRIIAALSISGSLSAVNFPERQGELSMSVIEAADLVSARLGFLGPA